jgi:hypothetical protein
MLVGRQFAGMSLRQIGEAIGSLSYPGRQFSSAPERFHFAAIHAVPNTIPPRAIGNASLKYIKLPHNIALLSLK